MGILFDYKKDYYKKLDNDLAELVKDDRYKEACRKDLERRQEEFDKTLEHIKERKKQNTKLRAYDRKINKEVDSVLTGKKDVMKSMKKSLFPYQLEAVKFTLKNGGNVLLTHEMGLGKTAIALSWLRLNPRKAPVIVLCPQSLKFNWVKECSMFYPELTEDKIEVISGRTLYELDRKKKLFIINFDLIAWWAEYLQEHIKPKVLVIDEIHYINNPQAKRSKSVLKYLGDVKHIIGLSGTPIKSRPIEFFTSLQLVDYENIRAQLNDETGKVITGPVLLSSYARRYCGRKRSTWGKGWDDRGATNTKELHDKLKNRIMLRRKKAEVQKDLPDKIKSSVYVEISNRKKYNEAEQDLLGYIEREYGTKRKNRAANAQMFVKFSYLRQLVAEGKVKNSTEWIKTFLDTTPDKKLVVFGIHKKVISELTSAFKESLYVLLVGGMSAKQKNESVERFQNDPDTRLFFGNIQAAGVGITLTASDCVLFVELPWTPGELDQAGDRCHRIGQKNTVNIYHLIGRNTIDGKLISILDQKAEVIGKILDGKSKIEGSITDQMISMYKENQEELDYELYDK